MLPTQSLKRILFLFVVLVSPLVTLNSQNAYSQASAVPTDAETIAAGEILFTECKVCHTVQTRLIGPALKGVYDRRELPWIYAFVKNSTKVIASGDEQAVAIFNEYNEIPMTSFDTFSDEEILSIMAYIKDQDDNAPAEVTLADPQNIPPPPPEGLPAVYLNAIIVGAVVLLLALVIVLGLIVSRLSKYIRLRDDISEEDKEYVKQRNPMELIRNKAFIGIAN